MLSVDRHQTLHWFGDFVNFKGLLIAKRRRPCRDISANPDLIKENSGNRIFHFQFEFTVSLFFYFAFCRIGQIADSVGKK